MNKNTKMILGVGAVAIVGYLVYKQMQPKPANFANLTTSRNATMDLGCPCKAVIATVTLTDGTKLDKCAGGQYCPQTPAPVVTPKSDTLTSGFYRAG